MADVQANNETAESAVVEDQVKGVEDADKAAQEAVEGREEDAGTEVEAGAEAAADDGDKGDAGEEAGKEQPAKRDRSADARIRDLNSKYRAERAAREAFERRVAALEAERQSADAAEDGPKEPKADDYEYGELDSKYIRDSIAFHTAVAVRKEREALIAEQRDGQRIAAENAKKKAAQDRAKAVVDKGLASESYDDYEEVVVQGAQDGTYALTEVMFDAIADSDVGADVLYKLASEPEEASRIAGLSPAAQVKAILKIEGELSAAAKAKEEPRLPKAKPMPESPRGQSGKFTVSPDTTDFRAYKRAYGKLAV